MCLFILPMRDATNEGVAAGFVLNGLMVVHQSGNGGVSITRLLWQGGCCTPHLVIRIILSGNGIHAET